MKMIIVALALVAVAAGAAVVPYEEPIAILRSSNEQSPEGSYDFSFETANGIQRAETGEVKEILDEEKKPQRVVVVRGSYSYTNPDGVIETIAYFADESGFHAEGPSVPKEAPASRR